MSKLIDLSLRFPKTAISLAILITLLFAQNLPHIEFDPDVKTMIPKDFPAIQNLEEIDETFGGSEILIVAAESEKLFTQAVLQKFENLHIELEELSNVDKVLSIYSIKEIVSTSDGFEVNDFWKGIPKDEDGINFLKERISNNDHLYRTIVSEDFSAMSFILMFSSTFSMDDIKIRNEVESLAAKYSNPDNVYTAGIPITRSYLLDSMQKDMQRLLPLGILLMIILLAVSFRSWMGVFLPLIVVIMSLIWTIGLMVLVNEKFVIITILIPIILIAVANDYGIHIIVHYFENIRQKQFNLDSSKDKMAAIRETVSSLKRPISLAGITTVIGLLSLLGHFLPPAKRLGLLAGFGIIAAFVLSLTFIPAVLVLLRTPPGISGDGQDRQLNRVLIGWGKFITKYKIPVLIFCALFIIISGLKIPQMKIDTDPVHYYRKGTAIRDNNEKIGELFGGSSQLSVVVYGDIKSPETLHKMKELSRFLEKDPLVTDVVSIVDQVESMHEAWNEGDSSFKKIPDERAVIAAYLELFSMQGGDENIERLVDVWGDSLNPDGYHSAQILARLGKVSSAEVLQLINKIEAYIDQNYVEVKKTQVGGSGSLIGIITDLIARGQLRSLALSIVLVLLATSLVFRSFQAGVYSIIPLGSAVIFVFGLMSYLNIELNVATSMLTSILIGVGIDYTIHFLWHYRRFVQNGASAEDAVIKTLTTSGKGIIFNAFSVMVGFAVLMISGFLPIFFFGFVIVFSIGMCLFGALAFLPAVIVLTKPKFIFKSAIKE